MKPGFPETHPFESTDHPLRSFSKISLQDEEQLPNSGEGLHPSIAEVPTSIGSKVTLTFPHTSSLYKQETLKTTSEKPSLLNKTLVKFEGFTTEISIGLLIVTFHLSVSVFVLMLDSKLA